jgi:transaldolase
MAIFVDSARVDEVRRAMGLGYVRGVTTNPTLMAQVDGNPRDVIERLCGIGSGPVFYQLTGATIEEREREGREFHSICPDRVVLKVPATTENMTLVANLSGTEGGRGAIPCAVTALFAAHQAYVACEAGARYLIPYVNRATRLMGDGPGLVGDIADVLAEVGAEAEILAASIKSPAEAVETVLAGAHHLTLPLDTILALGDHPLSDAAIEAFGGGRSR